MIDADVEMRVASHLKVVADTIPAAPPRSFSAERASRARSHRRRRWQLGAGLGLTAVLTAGGVGIAAASGAFSGPPPPSLQRLVTEDQPAQQAAEALQAAAAAASATGDQQRAAQLQADAIAAAAAAAAGKPAPAVPSASPTTTLPPPDDLDQQVFRVTDPGPEGTTISVWSERTGAETGCLASVESAAGQSADPGYKPPTPDGGGCSGGAGFPSSVPFTYGMDSHIWASPSGAEYQIVTGELSATATQMVFTFGDGTTLQATAVGGFFALGVPEADFTSGGTVTAYGPSGTVLSQNPVE